MNQDAPVPVASRMDWRHGAGDRPYGGADGGPRCALPCGNVIAGAVRWAGAGRRTRTRQATAVPSSSTISPGIASRVTPSIVLAGATPAAPSRPASVP